MTAVPGMPLPPGWYAFGSPDEFRRGKPSAVRRFGLDLVVWQDAHGRWVAQLDHCPHRSASLSRGRINRTKSPDDRIVCPFHGFEFNAEGACQHVPEIGRDA